MQQQALPIRTVALVLLLICSNTSAAWAVVVSLTPSHDNTLYEYDPTDLDSPLNSNGSGDFFSAGRNRSRSLIRRGLIRFDLSGLPDGATVVPGSVELQLEIVDSPARDVSGESRDFWLIPLDRAWGEGASVANIAASGSGSGAPASPGDATWLHTAYDPAIHDPRDPQPDDSGYWPLRGAVGDGPFDPSGLGSPSGTVPAAPYLGPVTFSAASLEGDLAAWLADPAGNHGWLMLGDERIDDSSRSSNRGFASRENLLSPPRLVFTYVLGPLGDFDANGIVDGTDFLLWQQGFGIRTGATREDGDADADGDVDGDDFLLWQQAFLTLPGTAAAAVPEPTAMVILIATLLGSAIQGKRQHAQT